MNTTIRSLPLALVVAGLAVGCAGTRAHVAPEEHAGVSLTQRASDALAAFARPGEGEEAEELDLSGDGRPNVVRVFAVEGEELRVVRKAVDLNGDGAVDVWSWYAPDGTLAKQSFDLDFDGHVDVTSHFAGGQLVRKEIHQGLTERPNAFKYYEKGRLVRVERDRSADGRIDTWEYWEGEQIDRIGVDVTGDGNVDRWTKQARAEE